MSNEQLERKVDRTDWPTGPWDDEPDRDEWRFAGMPCLIVRNDLGGLCGYVGLPPGHPMHGQGCDSVRTDGDHYPDVHGGLTYADKCVGHICHVPRECESDDVWWIGFDCAHAGDEMPGKLKYATVPGMPERSYFPGVLGDTYKPLAYVRDEVQRLALQMLPEAARQRILEDAHAADVN